MSGSTENLTTARLEGRACGQHVAGNAVSRARTDLTLLSPLAPALEHGENAGADSLAGEGWLPAEIQEWRLGYFEGAEPVVLKFLGELQAAADFKNAQADALSALSRMESAAKRIGAPAKPSAPLPVLGGPKLGALLRPGDLGTLPFPSRP